MDFVSDACFIFRAILCSVVTWLALGGGGGPGRWAVGVWGGCVGCGWGLRAVGSACAGGAVGWLGTPRDVLAVVLSVFCPFLVLIYFIFLDLLVS
jgi:hypothetical protein